MTIGQEWGPWQSGPSFDGTIDVSNDVFMVQNYSNVTLTVEQLSTIDYHSSLAFAVVWNNEIIYPAAGFHWAQPHGSGGTLSQAWFTETFVVPASTITAPVNTAFFDESWDFQSPHPFETSVTLNYRWKYATDDPAGEELFDIYSNRAFPNFPNSLPLRSDITNTDATTAALYSLIGQITASIPAGTSAGINGYLSPTWTSGSLDLEDCRDENSVLMSTNTTADVPPLIASVGPIEDESSFIVTPHRQVVGGELPTTSVRLLWFQATSIDYVFQVPNYRWGYRVTFPTTNLDGQFTDGESHFWRPQTGGV